MANNFSKDNIELLIPWYLNGTLEEEENKKVEEYLEQDRTSKDEVILLNLIKSAVIKTDETISQEISPQFLKMEESIIQRIDSTPKVKIAPKIKVDKSLFDKLSSFFESVRFPAMNLVPIAALLLIQFAIIAGLIAKLYFEKPDQYTTLSGTESVETIGRKIMVAFDNSATEKEIRDIILDINAKIISGPNRSGIYIIEVRDPENKAAVENIIKKLRSKKEIIKLAEEAY